MFGVVAEVTVWHCDLVCCTIDSDQDTDVDYADLICSIEAAIAYCKWGFDGYCTLASLLLTRVVVVVIIVIVLLHNIGCCRDQRGADGRDEFCLMIDQAFMKVNDGRRDVSAFHLIDDWFVFFRQSFKNDINLIFVINRLTKDSEIVHSCGEAL